jgi:hypothetical protein
VAYVRSIGSGDIDQVRGALDLAWDVVRSDAVGRSDPRVVERCNKAARACTELVSDEPEAVRRQADVAVAAVVYALQAAADTDRDAAAYAARQVTDALDDRLRLHEIDRSDPEEDRRVWEHPLVMREVARRVEDLEELRGAGDWRVAVEAVRSRAASHPALGSEADLP